MLIKINKKIVIIKYTALIFIEKKTKKVQTVQGFKLKMENFTLPIAWVALPKLIDMDGYI